MVQSDFLIISLHLTLSFLSRSSSPRDLSLHLSGSQSDTTLKQIKQMTSPLSKIAKGVQNIGMNLDPRKIGSKVSKNLGAYTQLAQLLLLEGYNTSSKNFQMSKKGIYSF